MSNVHDLSVFVAGMIAAGYLTGALFFGRFYVRTRDQLFLYFCGAFVLLFAQRIALTLAADGVVDPIWYRTVRLLAFLLILVAIVNKNRASR